MKGRTNSLTNSNTARNLRSRKAYRSKIKDQRSICTCILSRTARSVARRSPACTRSRPGAAICCWSLIFDLWSLFTFRLHIRDVIAWPPNNSMRSNTNFQSFARWSLIFDLSANSPVRPWPIDHRGCSWCAASRPHRSRTRDTRPEQNWVTVAGVTVIENFEGTPYLVR